MPDRVFCDQHDPKHCAKWVNASRPLFDDICPYCEIDRLKGELEEAHEELGISIKERIDLGGQLAEARTEAEEAKFAYKVARDDATQARQEAAMTIERHLLGMFWCIPSKENEPMIYRDQAIEWLRGCFKLEG